MAWSLSELLKRLGIPTGDDTDGPIDIGAMLRDLSALPNGTDADVVVPDSGPTLNDAVSGGPGSDTLPGSAGDDIINGSSGADTMIGGPGSDIYYVDDPGDVAVEFAGQGFDTVIATTNYTIQANVEALYILGTGLTGTGSAGNDVLLSDYGANALVGLDGNDLYYVRHTGDTVVETANNGYDIVIASFNYTIPANVEALYMVGSGLTGIGSSGNDILLSAGGANTLNGGGGNDVYYVQDNSNAVIVEAANGGFDTAIAINTNYTIPDNVEILCMYGPGLTGTGSANNDILISDAGLLGGAGGNTLIGLGGDDLYFVTSTSDVVTEAANGGVDTIIATANYTIAANVETIYMIGTGLTGTGSANADTLITIGANTLTGGAGNDMFVFFAGSTNGATISDFAAAAGDKIVLSGYGAGATFTNIDATHWQVNYNGGASHDIITFSNSATIDASDFVFV